MFQLSQNEKKGIMIFFNGQSVPGVVRKYNEKLVHLYNQQYDDIYIVIDQIDAVAMQ